MLKAVLTGSALLFSDKLYTNLFGEEIPGYYGTFNPCDAPKRQQSV
jgi:hypothetical protein